MTVTLAAMLGGIGRPVKASALLMGSHGTIMETPGIPRPSPSLSIAKDPATLDFPLRGLPITAVCAPRRNLCVQAARPEPLPTSSLVHWCGGNPFHHPSGPQPAVSGPGGNSHTNSS